MHGSMVPRGGHFDVMSPGQHRINHFRPVSRARITEAMCAEAALTEWVS